MAKRRSSKARTRKAAPRKSDPEPTQDGAQAQPEKAPPEPAQIAQPQAPEAGAKKGEVAGPTPLPDGRAQLIPLDDAAQLLKDWKGLKRPTSELAELIRKWLVRKQVLGFNFQGRIRIYWPLTKASLDGPFDPPKDDLIGGAEG